MKIILVFCALFALTYCQNSAPQRCTGQGEEPSSCGSPCQTTCDNYKTPINCMALCVSGCFCKEGLVRNGANCINPKDCPVPQQCPKPHQKYNECGSACAPSCKNPKPELCTQQCVQGCFCEAGYVDDGQGNCVELSKCPAPKCPANERWINDTCVPPPMCTGSNTHCPNNKDKIMCKISCSTDADKGGCVCNDGYLRDNRNICVRSQLCNWNSTSPGNPTTQCPKPHQIYNECGSACAPTCKNPKPEVCTEQCVRGCFCENGFVEDGQGNCVELAKCPAPKCPANERWVNDTCVPPPSCTGSNTHCPNNKVKRMCKIRCSTDADKGGCVCINGYLRDDQSICVRSNLCNVNSSSSGNSTNQCPKPNQIYKSCGTACEPTCATPTPSPVCTKQCIKGCFCEPGYLKNNAGDCVKPANCFSH